MAPPEGIMESITPESLNPSWRPIYELEIEAVWMEGVRAAESLYLLDRILAFPFTLLGFGRDPFWRLISAGLYESAILALSRISADKNKETLTLQKLKRDVLDNIGDGGCREAFGKHLEWLRFDRRLELAGGRLKPIRHQFLAHLNLRVVRGGNDIEALRLAVPVAKLRGTNRTLQSLITALSLGVGRSFLEPEYSPLLGNLPGTDPRKDIDKLLDHLASTSPVLSLPEEQPTFWPAYRTNLSTDDLVRFNAWRRRLGMPPA